MLPAWDLRLIGRVGCEIEYVIGYPGMGYQYNLEKGSVSNRCTDVSQNLAYFLFSKIADAFEFYSPRNFGLRNCWDLFKLNINHTLYI